MLYNFNPYEPTKVVYSIQDQLIYWNVEENSEFELPVFGGFVNNVMWSQEYFVLAYSEWEGTSYRVFNILDDTVRQNGLTQENPFFVYHRGDKVLGFLNDSTLVSIEITGSDLTGEYNGVVRLFSCDTSSLIAEYEVNDARDLFISDRKLLTTIDIFSNEWPMLSNLTNSSERVLSEVVAPDVIKTLFDFTWVPDDIALFRESFIFKRESDLVLASGYKKEDDGNYLKYLLLFDSGSASVHVIENVGYNQYSWLD